ncbi:hypothetical protein ACFL35_06675 [Candidatus Riflebacteria bacterium]
MSEYQYYEFVSVDKPLSQKEMKQLRSISTRARITPSGFVNEYNWGDLSASPVELMKKYFDAHFYYANWGTIVFMVRLPEDLLLPETVSSFVCEWSLDIKKFKKHWLITWSLDEPEIYDTFFQEGMASLSSLLPIRQELLEGDLRSLYIGWLACVSRNLIAKEVKEPIVMPGFGNLTAPQQVLADILEVEPDLQGASHGIPPENKLEDEKERFELWLKSQSKEKFVAFAKNVVLGNSARAKINLRKEYYEWRNKKKPGLKERTVKQLQTLAEKAKRERIKREKKAHKKAETKRKRERKNYLSSLAKNYAKVWKETNKLASAGTGSAYDKTCDLIKDLAEAYNTFDTRESFDSALAKFMKKNQKRPALTKRLLKEKLLKQHPE